MKNFFKSKQAIRFYWSLLNTTMGLGLAFVAYMASENVMWAVSVLPIATGLSQFITKYLNQ